MGSLFKPSGGDPVYAKLPGFSSSLGKFAARTLPSFTNPLQTPHNLASLSGGLQELLGQARQFGATGLDPFIEQITSMAVDGRGGLGGSFDVIDQLAENNFSDQARQLRSAAGASGTLNSTGFVRELGDTQEDIMLNALREKIALEQQAYVNQLGANQLGLSIPGAYQGLASVLGLQDEANRLANAEHIQTHGLLPLQALQTAAGFIQPLSATTTPAGPSMFDTLFNAGVTGLGVAGLGGFGPLAFLAANSLAGGGGGGGISFMDIGGGR